MASSNVAVKIVGQDLTSRVFRGISAAASAAGRVMAGVGAAASGAFMAAGAGVLAAANKLGNLSDVAQRASMTTDDLTRMSAAFDMMGMRASGVEDIANAMMRMSRANGRTGYEGFRETIEEIAKMPTVAERANAAMLTFGRAGLTFLPMIAAAAKEGTGNLDGLVKIMPGVSQAAANVGDSVADSFGYVTKCVKTALLNAVGGMLGAIDNTGEAFLKMGVRVGAYIEYYIGRAFASIKFILTNFGRVLDEWGNFVIQFFKGLGEEIAHVISSAIMGEAFADANFERFGDIVSDAWKDMEIVPPEVYKDLDEQLAKRLENVGNVVKNAAITMEGDAANAAANLAQSAQRQDPKLVLGGTYSSEMAGRRQQNRTEEKILGAVNEIKNGIKAIVANQNATLAVIE